MLSCLRQPSVSSAGSSSSSSSVAGGGATSIYSTRLGITALTWSRSFLGLSLLIDLPFSSSLKIPPWTLRRRRGTRRCYLPTGIRHVAVEVTWDLTRAVFSSPFPDPVAGFLVAVAVDGEPLLAAGDLEGGSLRRASPISRRERVKLKSKGGRIAYSTSARFQGRQRKISIELEEREKELGMEVKLEGKRVLEVTRLQWKFRGSERLTSEGGDRIQISWDFCNWFSVTKGEVDAVFVFRFERDEVEEEDKDDDKGCLGKNGLAGNSGRSWNWSESSFGSTAVSESWGSSSAAGSSVMDWESVEEADMRRSEGFSLVVFGFKN